MLIDKIIKEQINEFIISEINHLSQNNQVTVCSLQEYQNILKELNINNDNCQKFEGKYAFIEIGSGFGRIEQEYEINSVINNPSLYLDSRDFYENGQFVLKPCANVLCLIFDDIKSNKTDDDGYFNGRISKNHVLNNADNHFKYKNPILFNEKQAKEVDEFVTKQLNINPNVHFIVHCLMGQSRSAAIGSYIIRKINTTNFSDFLKDYDKEGEDELGIKNSQFSHGINLKQYGHPKYPNKTVLDSLTKVGKLPKEWYKKEYNQYFNIPYYKKKLEFLKQSGDIKKYNKFREKLRKFYDNEEDFLKDFN